jgi:hypothetical protein
VSRDESQEQRTQFALDVRAAAADVMADRVHATPLIMHIALLLDTLARVTAAEGAHLDRELRTRTHAVVAALQAELAHRKTGRTARAATTGDGDEDEGGALTVFATTYTEIAAGYPTPEAIADVDQAALVLVRYVTRCLSPMGAPRPYPVDTLARTTRAMAELVRDTSARAAAVAETAHGHNVLPDGVPGALRPIPTRPDVDVADKVATATRWLGFAADELADLVDPLDSAEAALALLDHTPAPSAPCRST